MFMNVVNTQSTKRAALIVQIGNPGVATLQHSLKHRLIRGGLVNYCPKCLIEIHGQLTCSKGHSVETIGEDE